jgi:predicted transcriptional regulator of viral defense system
MQRLDILTSELLRRLAAERRRIVADWRILIETRRIAQSSNAPLPDAGKIRKWIEKLARPKLLQLIEGVAGVYRVDVPYADVIQTTDEQVVQEANPLAVFSHLTALAHHGLTDQIPKAIQATHYAPHPSRGQERIPLGTAPEEWSGLQPPPLRRPDRVGTVPVRWFLTKGAWDFGHTISYNQGLPIYITDVERTLLDGLRAPGETGGIVLVLRAWRRAKPVINVDRLVAYTDRLGIAILRQRVGFVLEELGLDHPRLAAWKKKLLRGSSVRLVANEDFAPKYSAAWSLSLNVPASALAELQEE